MLIINVNNKCVPVTWLIDILIKGSNSYNNSTYWYWCSLGKMPPSAIPVYFSHPCFEDLFWFKKKVRKIHGFLWYVTNTLQCNVVINRHVPLV